MSNGEGNEYGVGLQKASRTQPVEEGPIRKSEGTAKGKSEVGGYGRRI
jgi:hypothetical protein